MIDFVLAIGVLILVAVIAAVYVIRSRREDAKNLADAERRES